MTQSQLHPSSKSLIAVSTPFPLTSTKQIQKYLTKDDLDKISREQQNINLELFPIITLSKYKTLRSLYEVKLCEYKNKSTGQIIQIIQQSNQITKIYDYIKMCDFYTKDNKQQININQIKNMLQQNIILQHNFSSFKFIPHPHGFLKNFNLGIINTDLLINKSQTKKQLGKSKNISFGQDIPNAPETIPEYVSSLKIFPIVQEYFQKRPCWLRNVIQYKLRLDGQKGQYTPNELKNILKYICYTYRDGPWKHVFCRFGFNPTIQSQGALYQTLMIKIKKKQFQDYQQKNQNILQNNDIYDPTLKQIPKKYLRIYQLCDIQDRRIDDIINNTRTLLSGCSKDEGWFTKGEFNQIQQIVKNIREERSSA